MTISLLLCSDIVEEEAVPELCTSRRPDGWALVL
jgi:hypothetical protein